MVLSRSLVAARLTVVCGQRRCELSHPRVIPVVTAIVKKRDLDLYLNGLGTVTALKTVTIRSRVEGELTKVAFTEGQMVREGDLLAEIDTRPFEVQRDQVAGQLARDERRSGSKADFGPLRASGADKIGHGAGSRRSDRPRATDRRHHQDR